jgi:hypothetical protein
MDLVLSIFPYLIATALATVLGVLFFGLFSMVRGGEFERKHANRLMRLRVASQALAVVLIVIFFALLAR